MSETKVCPVCMNQIPLKVKDCCFYCGFDLTKLNSIHLIERAKQRFSCGRYKAKNQRRNNLAGEPQERLEMPSLRNYYISGLIGSSIPAFIILVLVFWSLGILLWAFALPVWLISGFSAGFIGCKFSSNQSDFTGFIATTLLGFLIASLMGLVIIFNFF